MIFYVLAIIMVAIIMVALPVTIYKIMMFNLSNWSMFESITLKNRSVSLATTSSLDGFLIAYKMVQKWWIYLKLFLCCPPMRHSLEWTHTRMHAHTQKDTHTNLIFL